MIKKNRHTSCAALPPDPGAFGAIGGAIHLSGRIGPPRRATARHRVRVCAGAPGLFAKDLFNRPGEAGEIDNDKRATVPLDQSGALERVQLPRHRFAVGTHAGGDLRMGGDR